MEHSQEGEQLKLLDPASLPTFPKFPCSVEVRVYGLGGGLGIGAHHRLLAGIPGQGNP